MGDRIDERLDRLPGERASAQVGDRAGDHHRKPRVRGKKFRDREERGLGVEGIKNRLDEQDVGPARDEVFHLFEIRGGDLLEGDIAFARIIHVARDRERAVERADRSRHKNMAPGAGVCRLARQLRGLAVQFGDKFFEPVIRLGDDRAAERVRLDDVRARGDVFAVDLADHIRAREHEKVVVSFQVLPLPVGEPLPAIVGFLQFVLLDHRPHRPVEDEDAFGQQFAEPLFGR